MPLLPTSQQLQRLPLRAIVTYALRSAQRVIRENGHEELGHNVFDIVSTFLIEDDIGNDVIVEALYIASDLAGYVAKHPNPRVGTVTLALRAVLRSFIFAMEAVQEAQLSSVKHHILAADAAEMAGNAQSFAQSIEGAAADFGALIELFGEDSQLAIGPAFDASEHGPLGPLS